MEMNKIVEQNEVKLVRGFHFPNQNIATQMHFPHETHYSSL